MQNESETRRRPDEDISLADLVRWTWRWRWLVVSGALAGLLLGLVGHLASGERFVVRLDIAVTDTPLGAAAFVRDISASVLRKHAGTAVSVRPDSRRGTLALVEHDVPADAIAVRQAAMREAAAALGDFLESLLSQEYAGMQASYSAMPPSPEAYAALTRFRLHLSALEEGLIQSVVVVSESVRRRGPGLGVLAGLGALAGAGVAAAAAFAADALRGRHVGLAG